MEFKADEHIALALAHDLLSGWHWSADSPWPALGMQSSGSVANGPLFVWVVAAFWRLTPHPVGVAALVALANIASLIPLWLWARRRLDEQRALLTLAIVAVSPFAVSQSRKIWMQDLLLPGLVIVLWGIEQIRDGRLWRGVILLAAGLSIVGQIHQSGLIAIVLLPIAAAIQYLAVDRRRTAVPHARPTVGESFALVGMVSVSIFFWWPYLRYLISIDWSHPAAREMATSFKPGLLFSLVGQVAPWDLVQLFRASHDAFTFDPIRRAAFEASIWLGLPLCVYGLWRWLRAPFTLPVIGIWWGLVIVVFALARIPERVFYVLVLSPFPALLAAGAFDGRLSPPWMERLIISWRWAYVASLLVLTVSTGAWLAWRGGAAGDYGINYEMRVAQARRLQALRDPGPEPLGLQPGEVVSVDPASFECHRVPAYVSWLVGWLEDMPAPVLTGFDICDGWEGVRGDESIYRWAIRPQGTP